MLRVGLTGGIGSGKSTVGQMLVAHGAYLIKADELAHELMSPGEPVYERVVATFGASILDRDGAINRHRLADLVFPTGRIAELNAIVHPAVIAAQEQWMDEVIAMDPVAVTVVEAALLLESGSWRHFDRLITVICSPNLKADRFAARQFISKEAARIEVERRTQAQATDEEKIKVSQYVIDNSGSLEDTQKRVDLIWPELERLSLAAAKI